jgi:hypothetical protein
MLGYLEKLRRRLAEVVGRGAMPVTGAYVTNSWSD